MVERKSDICIYAVKNSLNHIRLQFPMHTTRGRDFCLRISMIHVLNFFLQLKLFYLLDKISQEWSFGINLCFCLGFVGDEWVMATPS